MLGGFDVGLQLFSPWFLPWGRLLLAIWGSYLGPRQPVSLTVDICHECFWFPHGPELLVTLVFGLGLCSEGTGSICLILYKVVLQALPIPDFIDCLHWLSADGVQGYPVVIVFDKVEEGILRLLEVIIKTNGSCLVEKLQLYEPSISFGSGQEKPVNIRFWVVHLAHCQELCSLCIKIGQIL